MPDRNGKIFYTSITSLSHISKVAGNEVADGGRRSRPDAVENYPASKVGWLMGKEMDSVSRLINVAVTRARGKLIAVANATFWENKFGGKHSISFIGW